MLTNETNNPMARALALESLARLRADTGIGLCERAFPQLARQLMHARKKLSPNAVGHTVTAVCAGKPVPWIGTVEYGVLSADWPRCLVKLEQGDNLWLPLGRKYKPLGYPQHHGNWFDYEQFADVAWRLECDPHEIIECSANRTLGWIYLYSPAPQTLPECGAYLRRVGRLLDATGDQAITYAGKLIGTPAPLH